MLKYLIIFAAWITPGIALFLYLLWISKRAKSERAQLQLQSAEQTSPTFADNDRQRLELSHASQTNGEPRKIERFG